MNANVIKPREVPAALSQLRAEIERCPKDQGGKRRGVPEELKRKVARLFYESGMKGNEFAAAVSVSETALYNWKSQFGSAALPESKAKIGFRQVSVQEDSPLKSSGITIEGPNGLRITGLSEDAVARLWRALC